MKITELNPESWQKLCEMGTELKLAIQDYPSRGQTSTQKLYATRIGKIFYKKVSARNHTECRINPETGSLAEREFWAFKLAHQIGLETPELTLLDSNTTVQRWYDLVDAKTFRATQGPLKLNPLNVFECALFDWISGQTDRHHANYLYDYINQKIILIDSANSFSKHTSMPDYLVSFEESAKQHELKKKLNSKICVAIKNLDLKHLMQIVPLVELNEINALFLRMDQIRSIKTLKDLIALFRDN